MTPVDWAAFGRRLGFASVSPQEPVHSLAASGYVRIAGDECLAILDVGRIGPDHLLGHAHADSLSWELSLFGRRVVVNGGTSCYGLGEERLRQRGTAAHSTVVVDGRNSSQVWSGFRVARRAFPGRIRIDESAAGDVEVAGSHDGYRRIPGEPVHHRCWKRRGKTVTVSDRSEGSFHKAEARFHFHPDLAVELFAGTREAVLKWDDAREVRVTVSAGQPRLESTTWHPEFGVAVPACSLVVEFEESEVECTFRWR